MITWENHPYYVRHLETYGMTFGKGYSENKMKFENIKPEYFYRIQELVKKRYQLRALNFSSNKEILPRANEMFDVFTKSHSVLSSFVNINEAQREYFKKKFISFLNPEYVKFVVDKDDKLVGFGIVTPSYAKALQKMRGKLFPFGIFHLLMAKKFSKTVTFYLIGVLPEYQNKGVTAIIFNEFHKTFEEKKITMCIRGPELDDNKAIQKLWKNFKPEVFKRRCTYVKDIQ
jgi:GNAT superfamily N-acetyltransferase